MRDKFERKLFREAKRVEIPNVLERVYQNTGIEYKPIANKRKKKSYIIAGSLCLSSVLILCVTLPLALHYSEANAISDSYIDFTIRSKNLVNVDNEVTTQENFSISVDKDLMINEAVSLNKNSKIICSNVPSNQNSINDYFTNLMQSTIKAGYININTNNPENNVISFIISSENTATKNKLKNVISSIIINQLRSYYIYGQLIDEETTIEENTKVLAKNLDIDVNKYLVINKINNMYEDKYDLSDLSKMSFPELINLVSKYDLNDLSYQIADENNIKLFDELKSAYEIKVQQYNDSLETNQKQIEELKNELRDSKYKFDKDEENLFMFDYKRELFEIMKDQKLDFDYQQLLLIPPKPKKKVNFENSNSLSVINSLKEKIASSRAMIQELINVVQEFKEKGKEYLPIDENKMNQLNENFKDSFNKKVDDFNFDNQLKDRGPDWNKTYKQEFSQNDKYWYKK